MKEQIVSAITLFVGILAVGFIACGPLFFADRVSEEVQSNKTPKAKAKNILSIAAPVLYVLTILFPNENVRTFLSCAFGMSIIISLLIKAIRRKDAVVATLYAITAVLAAIMYVTSNLAVTLATLIILVISVIAETKRAKHK